MDTKHSGNNSHNHGPDCGHIAVNHAGHIDYLQDGQLVHTEGKAVTNHTVAVSSVNPDVCTVDSPAPGHDAGHLHGPGCGHPSVPHGDHTDYLVNGILHHAHGNHCDNHGPITLA